MAFTWTNSIATGSFASLAALQEIRSNLDYIDNNLACVSYKASVDGVDDGTINSSRNATVYSTKCDFVCGLN